MKEKVLVGMSGGVDSAVAAYLLKKDGYDVIGVTLRTWAGDEGQESRCCEIDDAREAAEKIGIPYHTFNCVSVFSEKVIKPFMDDYIHGLTPNPCIGCNRYVKWEWMLYYAKVLGADLVATGHYASVVRLGNGRYTVRKALHAEKDQTYMLYRLTQEQLAATLMPLGKMSKSEVRKIAGEAGLSVASKPDSQEICFVPDGDYAGYIEKNHPGPIPGKGFFTDGKGMVLGTHEGIIRYTVGQRKGLGLALGYPAYVKRIDAEKNEVVIGAESDIRCRAVICRDVCLMGTESLPEGEKIPCRAKVRYHHPAQTAWIESSGPDRVTVSFDEPLRSAAPGQSAVFYDTEDCVIGGGIISEAVFA